MKQQNKNIVLLVVLVVLVFACFWAAQFNPYQSQSIQANATVFKIENAADKLTKAVFSGPKVNNSLSRTPTGWSLNDSLSLDPAMQQVLIALIEKVEVQRTVEGNQADAIVQSVLDTGIQVKLFANEELLNEFIVGGNPKLINTYFVKDGKAYLMQLPGYESYVAGMFEVKTLDWKDRTVFKGTWQDIVSLNLNYPNGKDLSFQYDKGLIKMQNNSKADSVKVMDYIETYNYFYVDQFLPTEHEALQQFNDFDPAGSIRIKALDDQKSMLLEFFTHPDFNAVLVRIDGENWAGIQKSRYAKYFPSPATFLKD